MLPGDPHIVLNRTWTPAPAGTPSYELVNDSATDIWGTRTFGNFFGVVERWDGDAWRPFVRAGTCGTVGVGTAIQRGTGVVSNEGALLDEPRVFTPGRYRYVLQYALLSTAGLSQTGTRASLAKLGASEHRQLETYQVVDVFDIGDANVP